MRRFFYSSKVVFRFTLFTTPRGIFGAFMRFAGVFIGEWFGERLFTRRFRVNGCEAGNRPDTLLGGSCGVLRLFTNTMLTLKSAAAGCVTRASQQDDTKIFILALIRPSGDSLFLVSTLFEAFAKLALFLCRLSGLLAPFLVPLE